MTGPRIGIAGWFGSGNVGDEVLLATTLELLRARLPDVRPVVLAADHERVRDLHGVTAEPLTTGSRLDKALDLARLGRRLGALDLLVLGPGTVLQERSPVLPWPGTLPLFGRLAGLARVAGTPVALFGVGVREDLTAAGRATVRRIGSAASLVAVRDEASAAALGPRARVVGDVAAAWSAVAGPPASHRSTLMAGAARIACATGPTAVALRPLGPDAAADGPTAALATAVRPLLADGAGFWPFALGRGAVGEDDRCVHAAHLADLAVVEPPLGPGGLVTPPRAWLDQLGGSGLVVAGRLHAALLALLAGAPTLAVGYEAKVAAALAPGRPHVVLVPPDADAATFAAAAARARDGRHRDARSALLAGAARVALAADDLAALATAPRRRRGRPGCQGTAA